MDKTCSEGELLKQAKNFNLHALAEIYDRYSPGLYGYSMRLLGDTGLAEDCVSETFSRLLQSLRNDHGPDEHLQAYLYRVAHNWITDMYRRHPAYFPLDEDLFAGEKNWLESHVELRIEREQVRRAILGLTPDQRQVIVLRFIEGWENQDVAMAVQKPVGAVKALQHRGLATLRRWLLRGDKEGSYEKESGN